MKWYLKKINRIFNKRKLVSISLINFLKPAWHFWLGQRVSKLWKTEFLHHTKAFEHLSLLRKVSVKWHGHLLIALWKKILTNLGKRKELMWLALWEGHSGSTGELFQRALSWHSWEMYLFVAACLLSNLLLRERFRCFTFLWTGS